jgi:hypothetical protein
MIERDDLISFAKLNNLRPHQQEKHYIQALVLASLADEPVVFKGGTYLWFFHGLERFSEDLDFTITGTTSDILQKISGSLRLMGVENATKLINDDARSVSYRISAKGPLNTSDIDLCHVYVEISKREKVMLPPIPLKFDIPAYGVPVKLFSGMALEEVGAEKIRAIITRNKARDVFDLAFLIGKKQIRFNQHLVNEKLAYYGVEFSAALFYDKLREKKTLWGPELKSLISQQLADFNSTYEMIRNWTSE